MRFIYLGALVIIITFFVPEIERNVTDKKVISAGKSDSITTITISVVGDIMCHSVQYNYAYVKADSFDFSPIFLGIIKYLNQSDFLFGNLETVTAGANKGYSGYPQFNSPDDFITAIKTSGFDLLTTANNHAFDRGEAGIIRTIEQIKLNHLNYNGTFLSERDRDSTRIFDIKGIKVAFLAYTYGLNGFSIPRGKDYLVNIIDTIKIKNDIKLTRSKGIDIVVVHLHFGDEYQRTPNKYQRDVVRSIINSGADIIIGGHTHVLQPIELFKTNKTKLDSGFVIYSMGNFISNQRWRYSDGGAILTFSLKKDFRRDSVYLKDVEFLPIWAFKGNTRNGREYILIPSESAFNDTTYSFLTPADRKLAAESFFDTKGILTKNSSRPKLNEIYKMNVASDNKQLLPK